MRPRFQTGFGATLLAGWLAVVGCSTTASLPSGTPLPESAPATSCRACQIAPELQERILALDPERVTGAQVREILAHAPAPQIIAIHGGILPIKAGMNSLAEFLVAMGYPESSLRNPATGDVAYGYYFDSDRLAGAVAWYTERDGLRPMLIGHSQGGIQVMRVLHKLAGDYPAPLRVWNPETQKSESRTTIWDPVTRQRLTLDRVQVCYAAVAAAGGAARFLPNEWDMNRRLRKVPNSVIDFTGFHKEFDPWGGDYLGYGSANEYQATGTARVENIRLPTSGAHWTIPYAGALLEDPEALERIQNYRSAPYPDVDEDEEPSTREAFATVVWYEVKRHWVLELQRLVRAQASSHGRQLTDASQRGTDPAARWSDTFGYPHHSADRVDLSSSTVCLALPKRCRRCDNVSGGRVCESAPDPATFGDQERPGSEEWPGQRTRRRTPSLPKQTPGTALKRRRNIAGIPPNPFTVAR